MNRLLASFLDEKPHIEYPQELLHAVNMESQMFLSLPRGSWLGSISNPDISMVHEPSFVGVDLSRGDDITMTYTITLGEGNEE